MWALWAFEPCLFAGPCCCCLVLGLCVVAGSAKELEVVALVVAEAAGVVDVVHVEWRCCCPAMLAGVLVSCEDAFAGCSGDVFVVAVFPCHQSTPLSIESLVLAPTFYIAVRVVTLLRLSQFEFHPLLLEYCKSQIIYGQIHLDAASIQLEVEY